MTDGHIYIYIIYIIYSVNHIVSICFYVFYSISLKTACPTRFLPGSWCASVRHPASRGRECHPSAPLAISGVAKGGAHRENVDPEKEAAKMERWDEVR